MTYEEYNRNLGSLRDEHRTKVNKLNQKFIETEAKFKINNIIEDEDTRIIVYERRLIFINDLPIIVYYGNEISKDFDFSVLELSSYFKHPQVAGVNSIYSSDDSIQYVGTLK